MTDTVGPIELPLELVGIIILYVYDGKRLPAMLLVCLAWSSPPRWIKTEMQYKKCMIISPTDPWAFALDRGYYDIIPLLHERKIPGCSAKIMDNAAKMGLLNQLMWLKGHRNETCSTDALDLAAANGHLKVVKWIHQNCASGCTTNAVDYAAINGHIDVVTFLLENRTEGFTEAALKGSARRPKIVAILQKHRTVLM